MIHLDIYVPILDKNYEVQAKEECEVSVLSGFLAEMISQKEQCPCPDRSRLFLLAMRERNILLYPGAALKTYGLQNGDELMLI